MFAMWRGKLPDLDLASVDTAAAVKLPLGGITYRLAAEEATCFEVRVY